MKDVGKFDVHLVFIKAISYILCPLGIFNSHLGMLLPFWYYVQRKIWQPWCPNQTFGAH
jgi:hypothetical protein